MKLWNICKNCKVRFYRQDHYRTRKALFCSRRCYFEYNRKTCVSCENTFIPHRKYYYRKRKKYYYKRTCKVCERDKANRYKRTFYKKTKKQKIKEIRIKELKWCLNIIKVNQGILNPYFYIEERINRLKGKNNGKDANDLSDKIKA
jgi:hypothetical protein